MPDKEVGEFWVKLQLDCGKGIRCDNHGTYFKLIIKLVQERAKVYCIDIWGSYVVNEYPYETYACHDFGIDYQEYLACITKTQTTS